MKAQRSFLKKSIDFAFDGLVTSSVKLENGRVITLSVYTSDTEEETISLVLNGNKNGLWQAIEQYKTTDKGLAKRIVTMWTQEEK